MRWRQFCAELLAASEELGRRAGGDARRAARGHAAHPARSRCRARPPSPTSSTGSSSSSRTTRARPASSGCSRTPARRPTSRRCRSGRRCRTTSRSRRAPRRRWRCSASSRTCSRSASRSADLPEEARAWERGVDELAEEDEEIGDYVRALEETRDTADLPRPAARRSPASSSATSSAARPTTTDRACRRLRRRRSPVQRVEAEAGVEQVAHERGSPASRPRGSAGCPGVEDPPAAPGASRSSAGRPGRRATRPSACSPGREPTAVRQSGQALLGGRQVGVGPLPVGAVVVREQGQPDRHRVDARLRAAGRRAPGCPCDFDIFSPW